MAQKKDCVKFPLSDEEYAELEKVAKEHNITVDECAQVGCLILFNEYNKQIFEDAKKVTSPHVVEVAEGLIEKFAKAGI